MVSAIFLGDVGKEDGQRGSRMRTMADVENEAESIHNSEEGSCMYGCMIGLEIS